MRYFVFLPVLDGVDGGAEGGGGGGVGRREPTPESESLIGVFTGVLGGVFLLLIKLLSFLWFLCGCGSLRRSFVSMSSVCWSRL